MKKFIALLSLFFLFSFVRSGFAAEIKLQDISSSTEKSVAVSVDTKSEPTENVKIVVENSPSVSITEIIESDIACATFSYVPKENSSEIICTLPSNQPVQGLIAKILFTSTSEDYKFTIVKEESQVGDLMITSVTNVGDSVQATTNQSNDTPNTVTQTPSATAKQTATPQKTDSIMTYLPYILLGVAGIFLISIIILLVTKKKDNVVLTDLPASSVQTQPIQQPVQQPQAVNFENIPQNLQNDTMQDNIVTQKPTLAEIVNQQAPTPAPIPEPVPTPTPTPMPMNENPYPTANEQADLEVLRRSENPSMVTNNPTPVQQPVQEVPTTPTTNNGLLDNYSANVSEGGLPEIGSTSPLDSPTTTDNLIVETEPNDNLISPNLGPIEQPTEPIVQPDVSTSMDADLQNSVNMEINNIPEDSINTPVGTTPQNPTVPTGQI